MIEILKNYLLILAAFLLITNVLTASGNEFDVNITNEISFIDVKHNGKEVRIQRNQSKLNFKLLRKSNQFLINTTESKSKNATFIKFKAKTK